MRKNFKKLPRKQNDTTSVLWRVQYFNGDKNRTHFVATDQNFPFHLATKKWTQAAIPVVQPQLISLWCPSRLGR